jgi:H+/Cl- antiporter ClcA
MTIPMPVGLYIPTMAVGAGFGRLFGEVLYVLGLRPEPLSALFAVVGMCERENI